SLREPNIVIMARNKKKIHQHVLIESVANSGSAFGRVEGKVVFTEGVIPGDIVDIQVARKRNGYDTGYVTAIHKKSDLRIEPFCTHFDICGGCTWQNVEYETQLQFKQQLVDDAFRLLKRSPGFPEIEKIIASPYDRYYRNKMEYTFTNGAYIFDPHYDKSNPPEKKPGCGFHVKGQFANVFDMERCYLQGSLSNEIRMAVRSYALMHGFAFYDLRNHTGYMRNLIIRNTGTGDLMVILVVALDEPEKLLPMMEHIRSTFPEITSLYYCINTKHNDVIYDIDVTLFAGKPHMIEEIDGIKYQLGPRAFFQTNTEQAKNLYRKTIAYAALKPDDKVYDLYTGLGSIALQAANKCSKVVGVELVEAAIADAKENAKLNNIDNCTFIAGDMAKIFTDDFIAEHGKANVVITDPPRAGMHKDVCLQLLKLAPERIVYVSCNPVTQARDIQLLIDDYKVTALQPFDQFPQTYHVESIALLERR
ncbi:MAG TPA: 23S rRNA (uracil(1939)-C(5))-methyltransferase RlmD, partial [Chitinophagales bacterium]|nr:23S rRNA (uracil(1939)-C(5))-methyltransferase RlmD [Chitinophagales bacterium]HNI55237.1 23S rRNA (uracil(1939)-C(5))-methyltransferase RlmD [Chitinophagales bacterium]HNJ90593.1 23S rRNA (uracil(1939)-C(5))-methyltransferase RlmD [Chitinophagales bacterium]HNM09632.1 23S rRNA (uracil(1939)-C(5))-methyltransferase RlmD [Chitinophagales bacterium]HNO30003.1 23S rRNA (uracil(1939)-C(5))-methyltransferase RlmD [Chitinophagales bacterium]